MQTMHQKRFICLFVALLFFSPLLSAWPDKYDWHIKKSARHFLPSVDWRLYKAQLAQESSLNPFAVSPVGARGLAQFMPGTWSDVQRDLGFTGSPFDPSLSIEAGAFYMSKMRGFWKWPRPDLDRHNLALACYNAGCGNILKAQKLCGNPVGYDSIMKCLPLVTGKHSTETLNYSRKIRAAYKRLLIND